MNKRRLLTLVLGIALIAVVAGGAWFFFDQLAGGGGQSASDFGSPDFGTTAPQLRTLAALEGSENGVPKQTTGVASDAAIVVTSAKIDGELDESVVDKLEQIEGVARADGFLRATGTNGEPVIGLPLWEGLVFVRESRVIVPELIEGQPWTPEANGKNAQFSGREFAATNETAYGYPLLGMPHAAPYLLNGQEMLNLGNYRTGEEEVDSWLLVSLDSAQALFEKDDALTGVYVRLEDTGIADGVAQAIRDELNGAVEVEIARR